MPYTPSMQDPWKIIDRYFDSLTAIRKSLVARGWKLECGGGFDRYLKDLAKLKYQYNTEKWHIQIEGSGIQVMNTLAEVCEIIVTLAR